MANVVPIANYIQVAQISQYLSGHDEAMSDTFGGIPINKNYTFLLRNVRRAVEWMFGVNPNDPFLNSTAVYMYQLCGRYASKAQQIIDGLAIGLPILSGPANQSISVGGTAIFSVTAMGTGPFVYQWYLNGRPIPNANSSSYQVANATLGQSGNVYSVAVTNSAGTTTSALGILTVTAQLVAYYYYGTTDYSSNLQGLNDNVPYLGTFPITSGQPLSFTWPGAAANNVYIVVKYPVSESTKTIYSNGQLNNGNIPSVAFDSVVIIGSWKYIFSKTGNTFSMDTTTPLIFS